MGETSGTNDQPSAWASPGFSPVGVPPEGSQPGPQPPAQPPYEQPASGSRWHAAPAQQTPGTYTFPSLEKRPLEPLAVASLVTSPIGPLGLGLGIAAVRRLKRNRRRGRGVAVAGIIVSSLFLAGSALAVATLALDGTFARLSEQPVAGDLPAARTASPVNLDVGNCVVTLPVTARVGEVTLTPCTQEHQFQVLDRTPAAGDAYPGEEALFAEAEGTCRAAFDQLDVGVAGWPEKFDPWYLVPSQENWSSGEQNIICFAHSTAGPVTVDLVNR